MRCRLNNKIPSHAQVEKKIPHRYDHPRKTNETNYLRVKTWRGFNLTILKVNKSIRKN